MFKKIVGKIKFRRKPLYTKLSNYDKVRHLSDKAVGLFGHMKKAYSDLTEINKELDAVVISEQAEIAKRKENMERAIQEISMNVKVQERLEDFIR